MPIVVLVSGFQFKIGHCRKAETEKERDQQAKQVEKHLSGYLTGGTKKIQGITGREKISTIIKRMRDAKFRGRSKLIKNIGLKRVEKAEFGARVDFVKKYLSLAKSIKKEPSKEQLKKIPEAIREELKISISKLEFVREEGALKLWRKEDGTVQWRNQSGRFSKGPRK